MRVNINLDDGVAKRFHEYKNKCTVANAPNLSKICSDAIEKWLNEHEEEKVVKVELF